MRDRVARAKASRPGRFANAVRRHVGRRGAVLLLIGLVWLLVGVGIATGTPEPTPGGPLFHLNLPPGIRVTLWCGAGLTATLAALVLTPRFQMMGYIALFIPPAIRSLSYLGGWVLSFDGQGGAPGAWVFGVIWGAIATLMVVIAGWPEHGGPTRAEVERLVG